MPPAKGTQHVLAMHAALTEIESVLSEALASVDAGRASYTDLSFACQRAAALARAELESVSSFTTTELEGGG
jgi:hypothetical protein